MRIALLLLVVTTVVWSRLASACTVANSESRAFAVHGVCPCLDAQPLYSEADFFTGDGAEVFNQYDLADADAASIPDFAFPPNPLDPIGPLWGKLVSTSDRGQKTIFRYDGRGRVTGVAKRMAKPGDPLSLVADRYAPHWYVQTTTYDGQDRPTVQSTGADVAELLGASDASQVSTEYSQRGTVKRVGSSYVGPVDDGTLVGTLTRDADGLIEQITYGDVARTSTHFQYDQRRRIASVQTDRGPPSLWTASPPAYTPAPPSPTPPSTLQLILEDSSFGYDTADNPVEMRDWRNPADWPAGAKPVTKKAIYDDFYRLTRLESQYTDGDDDWTSPYAAENGGGGPGEKPSPHVSFSKRILSQSFAYDALGNTVTTDDDAHGFYDRSLGAVTHGAATSGPYQLKAAANAPSEARSGALDAVYDDAGNLVSLAVQRDGTCLPSGASCLQRFVYDWDEASRLSRARRWDLDVAGSASDPIPSGTPVADLRYAYDGDNNRTLKTAVDSVGNQLHSVYVFGSLELRRATWTVDDDYERTSATEAAYLFAHGVRLARLYYAGDDVPTLSSGHLHVLFELPDYLGSSSFVVDGATSELVEATKYQAYGATESDYRPARWVGYRDDYRFTGKEEDIEVGLTYFGQRYLSPSLNRWMSPDPLATHVPGKADLNLYAYVTGKVLRAVDPLGLMPADDAAKVTADLQSQGLAEYANPELSSQMAARDAKSSPPTPDYSHAPPPASAEFMQVHGGGGGMTRGENVPLMPLGGTGALSVLTGKSAEHAIQATPIVGSGVQLAQGIASGNKGQAIAGAAGLALDVALMVGTGGVGALELKMPSVPGALQTFLADTRGGARIGAAEGMSTAKLAASTPQSALALSKQLASEAQLGEMAGSVGRPIAGAGTGTVFRDSARIADTYGGNAADWAKMTSSGYRAADRTTFATHWVENIVTRQQAEAKVVIDKFGRP